MSQPPPYTISFSFTGWSATYPSAPQPGTAIDAELLAIQTTLVAILRNLALIQRDDGALRNQIVSADSMSPAVLALLGASSNWTPRGAWVTAIAYAVSDVISFGTATYVCAIAHTSSALLSTDIFVNRWILIFDSAGAIPADGSVGTAKLADGAVTTAKIGFTALDLSGTVRAAAGVQAGTGAPNGLLHAKLTAGDAYVTVERGAKASGIAGYRWFGGTGSVNWTATLASGSDDLLFSAGATGALRLKASNTVESLGLTRAIGPSTATTGAGVGLSYAASIGLLDSYNYDTATWAALKVRGLTVTLSGGGVDVVVVSATGMDVTGTVKRGGVDLGWLDLPQNVQSTAYTLALADRGGHVLSNNVAGQTIVVPTNAAVPFPLGSATVIVNDGTTAITISTTGITLKQAGTINTGNRTLATKGVATLLKVGTDEWYISGVGLS